MRRLALVASLAAWVSGAAAAQAMRVGILPDSDSMPFMVAEAEGLFEQERVAVSLVLFKSPVERDAALQSENLEGAISDVLAAALAVQGGFDVRIAMVTDGRYGLVGSPGKRLGIRDLRGKPVGLSTNTIIQYFVDRAVSAQGIPASSMVYTAVPQIPVRLELLAGGQLAAAGLPEPYVTVAVQRGGTLLASSEDLGLDAGVFLLTGAALERRLGEARRLLAAYWKAAQKINNSPDAYRGFLVEKMGFPEEVRSSYRFVTYRRPRLPESSEVERALAWMRERGLLKQPLAAARLMDGRACEGW